MLKLAAWLKAMRFFYTVNFTFLVVGHTKNAADGLFNSLKHEYRKWNIFTMEDLVFQLNVSTLVTVIPTSHDDFLDYDTLLKGMYIDLAGKIKQNQVFSCSGDDLTSVSMYLHPILTITQQQLTKCRKGCGSSTVLLRYEIIRHCV